MNIGRGVYTGKLFLSVLSYTLLDLSEYSKVLGHKTAKIFTKMDSCSLKKRRRRFFVFSEGPLIL